MKIHWLQSGTIDSIENGLIYITSSAIMLPLVVSKGDIIIGQRCSLSGRAVSLGHKLGISLFITNNGATKLYAWLPKESGNKILSQIISSNTPYVINNVARWMLNKRFNQTLHPNHGVNVVRGREGSEVRKIYARLSKEYGVSWDGRKTTGKWDELSPINKTISLCNAALYSLTEVAIIHTGHSPYFGFLHGHSGKALVYDIADIVKFDYITPLAFRMVADGRPNPEWRARAACIRLFRRSALLRELISLTEETMDVAIKSLAEKPSRRGRKNLP